MQALQHTWSHYSTLFFASGEVWTNRILASHVKVSPYFKIIYHAVVNDGQWLPSFHFMHGKRKIRERAAQPKYPQMLEGHKLLWLGTKLREGAGWRNKWGRWYSHTGSATSGFTLSERNRKTMNGYLKQQVEGLQMLPTPKKQNQK